MIDLGLLQKFLKVWVLQTASGILMHQTDYVMSLLIEHEMLACVPKFIPLPELVKLRKNTCTSRVVPLAFQHIGGQLKYLTKTRWKIGLFSGTPQPLHAPTGRSSHASCFLGSPMPPKISLDWRLVPQRRGFQALRDFHMHVIYAGDIDERISSTRAYLLMMGQTPISWC